MIILSNLLRRVATLNLRETRHQNTLGKRPYVRLVEAKVSRETAISQGADAYTSDKQLTASFRSA